MKVIGIIATKNRLELLRIAVNSVLTQKEKVDQFIIVSDSTEEIYRQEKEFLKNIECILLRDRYTHNYAGNLNTAIDFILMKNDNYDDTYIAFLDDDDFWLDSYIYDCKNNVNNHDFIVSGLSCNCEGDEFNLDIPKELNLRNFLEGNPGIQGSNTFIKLTTLLKAGCFDENMSSTTDRDLFARVMKLNPTYIILDKYLVKVNNSNNRVRITNSKEIKKEGLTKFYLKNQKYMDEEISNKFFDRAYKVFGMDDKEFKKLKLSILENDKYEKKLIELHDLLYPELFNSFIEFKNVLKFIDLENAKNWFNENITDFKNIYEWFDFLVKSIKCKFKDSAKIITICLISITLKIGNMDISRSNVYLYYLESFKFIFPIYLRKCYVDNNIENIKEIKNECLNEIEIKGIIDYIRHQFNSNDTNKRFDLVKDKLFLKLNINKYVKLGNGSEGFVFESNGMIYKWFKNYNEGLKNHLVYLSNNMKHMKHSYSFEVINDDEFLLIQYKYVKANDLTDVTYSELKSAIDDFKEHGLVLTNVKRRNFVRDKTGIKYIDFGDSIVEFNSKIYLRSLLRAKQLTEFLEKDDLEFYKAINEFYLKGE